MGVNKEERDGEENKQGNTVEPPATDNRKSMVAEPADHYHQREPLSSRIIIGGCGATPPGGLPAPNYNRKQPTMVVFATMVGNY